VSVGSNEAMLYFIEHVLPLKKHQHKLYKKIGDFCCYSSEKLIQGLTLHIIAEMLNERRLVDIERLQENGGLILKFREIGDKYAVRMYIREELGQDSSKVLDSKVMLLIVVGVWCKMHRIERRKN
jgi:hypothetical protein